MPIVIHIPAEAKKQLDLNKRQDFGYRYPNGLDLRPGSPIHEKIKDFVLTRARESYDKMQSRYPYWNEIDRTLTAYIDLDEKEKAVKERDPRKPVSIVVPYSYATLETLQTYMVSAFLDMPYFRYEGVTDADTIGCIMLEQVIMMQSIFTQMGLSLHTLFRDSLAYGFGVAAPVWWTKYGKRRITNSDGTKSRVEDMLFEGHRLEVIDPYCYLPDPNVPIHEPQRGEFVGWLDKTNYMNLMTMERENMDIFNVRYLKGVHATSTFLHVSDPSDRDIKTGGSRRETPYGVTNPCDVIWQYATIIPGDEEWLGMGKSIYPEKWLFGVAGDDVVICAKQMDLDHDDFPIAVCAPDFDGHSLTPISRLELINGLQGVLDFLFSSHVTNVRKSINDMLIVDPFLVNMEDLRNPGAGKLIRMRRNAWGRGVQNAVQQLQVNDITRNHISDAAAVIDFMNNTSSAVDSVRGVMRTSGERRSATEAKGARISALSRLARGARVGSLMAMYPLGYMMASQTQQFMSRELYVSKMGRMQDDLLAEYGDSKGMKVYPEDIDVQYNVKPHDGSIQMGEHADTWVQIYQILAANPAVGSGFDMVRIFKHVARMTGAKNVNEFVQKGGNLRIKLAQDQQVASETEKGNIIPLAKGGAW